MALQLKFRGCMVGALVGDCLGCPFEYQPVSLTYLETFLKSKLSASISQKTTDNETMIYTDDTAMTKSVAQSLIENNGFNAKDMGRKFAKEYFEDPLTGDRSYGLHVQVIFSSLQTDDDIFEAAKTQFHGNGSFGNGAAMRVAPVPLFTFKQSMKETARLAKQTALLTHSHALGFNGAVLQSLAIKEALKLGLENRQIIPNEFLDSLINQMKEIEEEPKFYSEKLNIVKEVLEDGDVTSETIAKKLGNNVTAPKSVPTAIYAFLRSLEPIPFFETSNPFVRTLYLCFSLGGDTDTIGTMAAAIMGAYSGIDIIPEPLQKICEGLETSLKQADQLFEIVGN